MKTVVLVAPHFLPSFLPSVHRSRLWTYYLEEFGWRPIILTTDPKYYECQTSDEMLDLLPPELEVVRTKAIPTKPIRFIGDIAIRSLYWYYKHLCSLAESGKMDFLHFTIPASNAAVLGPIIYRKYSVPYGIDYIDPWIPETPANDRVFSKPWFAHQLAKVLEPISVSKARLITGINEAYFASVIRRNPHLRARVETAGMPYGGSERDFHALDRRPREPFLFDPNDGRLHAIYAGALLPRAFDVVDRLLGAVAVLKNSNPEIRERLRLHFVGTGYFENGLNHGHAVTPYIEKHGLTGMAEELPGRISYLDVLNHLRLSSFILVIGSTEIHYSPSKIYQSVMSRRPVFALLHEQCTAVKTLRNSRAGKVFTFTSEELPDSFKLASALSSFLTDDSYSDARVNWNAFCDVDARETSRLLAMALDRALARERQELADCQT